MKAWFAGWRCDCTILAEKTNHIPDVCPTHGQPPLGPIEWVEVDKHLLLGVQEAPK